MSGDLERLTPCPVEGPKHPGAGSNVFISVPRNQLDHAFPFDLLSRSQNLLCAAEVDVGGRRVAKAIMETLVLAMLGDGVVLALDIAGQEVMLEQDSGAS